MLIGWASKLEEKITEYHSFANLNLKAQIKAIFKILKS